MPIVMLAYLSLAGPVLALADPVSTPAPPLEQSEAPPSNPPVADPHAVNASGAPQTPPLDAAKEQVAGGAEENPVLEKLPPQQDNSVYSIQLSALTGINSMPSADRLYPTSDVFVGVRGSVLRYFGPLSLGIEGSWRTTAPLNMGTSQILPLQLPYRIKGIHFTEAFRKSEHFNLGAVAGPRLVVGPTSTWLLVQAGATSSLRWFFIEADRSIPYNRSYLAAGGYLGAALIGSMDPVMMRADIQGSFERGLVLGNVNIPQATTSLSLGGVF